jgi:hypothetical protein
MVGKNVKGKLYEVEERHGMADWKAILMALRRLSPAQQQHKDLLIPTICGIWM